MYEGRSVGEYRHVGRCLFEDIAQGEGSEREGAMLGIKGRKGRYRESARVI